MAPELALRPRTAPEIVDAAFLLARRHYLPLVTLAAVGAIVAAPMALLRSSVPALMGRGDVAIVTRWVLWWCVAAVLCLARGASVAVATEAYLGRTLEPAHALTLARRRAWPLLAAGACYLALIWGGIILLVVPALLVIGRYNVVPAVVMAEGLGPIETLRRTKALTNGRAWSGFTTVGIAYLVLFLVGNGADYATLALGGTETVAELTRLSVGVALSPFYSAAVAAFYVDLRIVHEGLDLEVLAAEIGAAAGAAAPPPAAAVG